MTLLTVNNLSKHYKEKRAVNEVSFQFKAGKCIALIGPNGAGKTTILRTLAGLLKPTAGTVQFSGQDANTDIRSLIGYLPQYPVFHSWMTGMEFLVYSGELASLSKSDATKRANQLLDRVDIAAAKNQRISKYSGGMKQRLGIAQAIIHQPKLLMLDEPVSSLDPIGRREVLTLMEELKNNMTILFSTHILSDADEISDELLLLHQGEIVESGSMDELREKYQTAKIELIIEGKPELYSQKLNELSNVTEISIQKNVLHVDVANVDGARREILAAASKEKWPVISFVVNRASLEDMFMKVVKQ